MLQYIYMGLGRPVEIPGLDSNMVFKGFDWTNPRILLDIYDQNNKAK